MSKYYICWCGVCGACGSELRVMVKWGRVCSYNNSIFDQVTVGSGNCDA
jgi:hypothetical protein